LEHDQNVIAKGDSAIGGKKKKKKICAIGKNQKARHETILALKVTFWQWTSRVHFQKEPDMEIIIKISYPTFCVLLYNTLLFIICHVFDLFPF
jgi:hypothetical protein